MMKVGEQVTVRIERFGEDFHLPIATYEGNEIYVSGGVFGRLDVGDEVMVKITRYREGGNGGFYNARLISGARERREGLLDKIKDYLRW